MSTAVLFSGGLDSAGSRRGGSGSRRRAADLRQRGPRVGSGRTAGSGAVPRKRRFGPRAAARLARRRHDGCQFHGPLGAARPSTGASRLTKTLPPRPEHRAAGERPASSARLPASTDWSSAPSITTRFRTPRPRSGTRSPIVARPRASAGNRCALCANGKADVIRRGRAAGVPLEFTLSCMNPTDAEVPATAVCAASAGSDTMRLSVRSDPTDYRDRRHTGA